MELPPISASLGAMGSISGKLDALSDPELKVEIGKLRDRLLKLSKAQDPPVTARIWMNDVRELSYDMDNCVDAEADWVCKMSPLMGRVKEANGRYERYKLESLPCRTGIFPIIDDWPPTVDAGQQTDIVLGLHGEGGPVDRLRHLLTDGDGQLKVLSIVGGGGTGKTTLAKQLWRKHKQGDYFHCRAFVRAAKKPDMMRILRSILAQVRPHQPPDASEMHELIHNLTQHLHDKRYFLIIDDLWATSVWDVATCAFPEGNHGSRIITTTEIEDVALASCSYQSKYIFKMEPLSVSHSKELFTSAVFGSGKEKSRELDLVSDEIIKRCDGLPQAIISISSVLASHGKANTVENWEQIQNSLPTNTTSDEILKQVLNFCYDSLPSCLQTCLLYLSIYPENYIILKEDIMKQWVAEGFICAPTEKQKMIVAESYFDKLVDMGLIQHIDVGYSNEVMYYAVHHMVHDLITSKSVEENFVTVIDYSQRTIRFSNKVSRLSLQFGSATFATNYKKPPSIGLSRIRSLTFIGLMSCFPSNLEFKLLRSLNIHIWNDELSTGFNLGVICKLLLLRYLQVTCNDIVHLPQKMYDLKHLETVEINARVEAIPLDIFHLLSLLHLRLGGGTEVPDVTGILKYISLNPPISLDESTRPPNSVTTIELLPPIFRIPKWIGQLTNLCILKVVVRELLRDDISNMKGLPSLTLLSLHVQGQTTELIGFESRAFSALVYFEFRCGELRLIFQEGAMPNLQRIKLGFNARRGKQYVPLLSGIENLSNVQEISGIIRVASGADKNDFQAAESAFRKAVSKLPSKVSVKRADMVEEECGPAEKQHVIREKDASTSVKSEQPAIPKQESGGNSQFIQRSNSKETVNVVQGLSGHQELRGSAVREVNKEEERRNSLARGKSSMYFKLQEIEAITNNFAEEQKVGSGGYGDVYRAIHQGEEIAVKKLHQLQGLDDEQFHRKFRNLYEVRHRNVVRLIGYCFESRHKLVKHMGKPVIANIMERVLCFEYMRGGSLDKHITDESCELDWPICYKIIRGTCEGLNYLHNAQERLIFHLDIKPANILLDKSMTPKIADLGLSKLVSSTSTHKREIVNGTQGYMPPEYVESGFVSKKFDVFSLGVVIIKMMAGNMGYFRYAEKSPKEFIEHVTQNWTKRLQAKPGYSSHEVDILGVTSCVEIALRCVEKNRNKRPCISEIVHELAALEAKLEKVSLASDVSKDLTVQEEERQNSLWKCFSSMNFDLHLIIRITNDFSDAQKVGSGVYGDVYKAVENGLEIAVKKLHPLQGLDDKQFDNEVRNLTKVCHKNVVRLIGYCYESQHKYFEHNKELVFARTMERVICFEYMQGGSLDKHITDEPCRLGWSTCYGIIKGACEGLNHLHSVQEKPIYHLELKPGNILLDKSMMPKIGDLGLFKLVASTETHKTEMLNGTNGYMPPEYINNGLISKKFDVFSLGVIILRMMAGNKGYFSCSNTPPKESIDLVSENWKERLQAASKDSTYEMDILRVRKCVEIALRCVETDRNKRPTIQDIVRELEELETGINSYQTKTMVLRK